jgi:inorganic triphosphatase YgiF
MAKETEIKLRASPEILAALRNHPLLKKRNKSGWQEHELRNQYFDTPQRDLSAAGVALRLRRDGEQVIQTLKSRGSSVAGLSERNEWDWYLSAAQLDLSLLDAECWPPSLKDLDKNLLAPVFTTDFHREKAEIAWGRGKGRVVLEAALDLGSICTGERQEPICELELELREGSPSGLLELAIELATDLPLMPCDISKAERGYRLFDADSYSLGNCAPAMAAEQPLDEVFASLAWQLLGNSQRLAEQYRFNGHWKLLEQWLQQLVELRALLASLGQAVPRASSHVLRNSLDALLADWRPRLAAGQQDALIRQQGRDDFAAELDQTRWGLFSLQASLWLLQRQWTMARNERGARQGQAQIGKWLPRLLAEEAASLQLKRYQQQPEDLAEQLPRLERLLVWLRHARQLLELPETDRLYGELLKLEALALQPISPETLAARAAQAHTVAGLVAWKQLLG